MRTTLIVLIVSIVILIGTLLTCYISLLIMYVQLEKKNNELRREHDALFDWHNNQEYDELEITLNKIGIQLADDLEDTDY